MRFNTLASQFITALSLLIFSAAALASSKGVHGVAMHGSLKYPDGFKHFEYVNPQAPKGGTLRLGVVGDNFDTFNPFIIKGVTAEGVGYMYQSLTAHAEDEPFSEYGLIAERIDMPDDRKSVTFYLNKNAKFSDGHPITAEDVAYTFELFTTHEKIKPFFPAYYADVKAAKVIDDHTITFEFSTDQNKELPLIMGQMAILPKHYWEKNDFGRATLDVPVTNGPYKVASVDPGRSITYVRDENYWAKDLPVNVGKYNFDKIIYEYYKDNTIALEAFKAGEYDYREERTARNWANAYVGSKFDSGELIKEEIKHERPTGMQAFVFNTRRELFSDARVREALGLAFDFEWANKNLFFSQYTRSQSYFSNSDLASSGMISEAELEILTPFKDSLPSGVFSAEFKAPSTEKPGSIRKNLRAAQKLLKEAGWSIQNGQLTHGKTGKKFEFEFTLIQKDFERVIQPFVQNLKKLGVTVSIRIVDTAQYINRLREFDFDMVVGGFGQSYSPGNEQREYWHSSRATAPGSRNYIGISDPTIDKLVDLVISAPDRTSLVNRTRALDRVLLWGHYIIPNWYNPVDRISYTKELARPEVTPKSGVNIDTWWMKPASSSAN